MSRVAIVGSCISRDVWRFRGDPGPDLLYICRTSLPSLLASPVAGFRTAPTPPGGLKPKPHRALVADITKTALAELVAFRPTHLIFDFIDERFDLVSVGDSLVARSGELEASGYLRQRAFAGARDVLTPGGVLVLYGPYRRHGRHTAPSNEQFDAQLRATDPDWGLRDLETVIAAAGEVGLGLDEIVEMPANNFAVVLRRG